MVTGAGGFTGRHFCKLAVDSGYEVVTVKSDLLDRSSLQAELEHANPNFVVHLAGVSFVGSADTASFYAVNVIGTTNLLDIITELPRTPVKILLASSASVYGNYDVSAINETVPLSPANHYGASKCAMEYLSRTYSRKLPVVIARPFNYTGRGQRVEFVIPKLVDHFLKRKPSISLGNINVEREFNDVQMVCNLYLKLLGIGVAGEAYNICTGKVYSLENVIEILAKLTGHSMAISINPELVRANEIKSLRGDPGKIKDLFQKYSVGFPSASIEKTLRDMLAC